MFVTNIQLVVYKKGQINVKNHEFFWLNLHVILPVSSHEVFFNFFMTEIPITQKPGPLICSVNQWTGFSMTGPSVMKELK